MILEQTLVEKLKQLPFNEQQELLNFAEFLAYKARTKPTLTSIRGLCADLKVDLTSEDIQEIRQEMWTNFPREEL